MYNIYCVKVNMQSPRSGSVNIFLSITISHANKARKTLKKEEFSLTTTYFLKSNLFI